MTSLPPARSVIRKFNVHLARSYHDKFVMAFGENHDDAFCIATGENGELWVYKRERDIWEPLVVLRYWATVEILEMA